MSLLLSPIPFPINDEFCEKNILQSTFGNKRLYKFLTWLHLSMKLLNFQLLNLIINGRTCIDAGLVDFCTTLPY